MRNATIRAALRRLLPAALVACAACRPMRPLDADLPRVEFNQHWIESRWRSADRSTAPTHTAGQPSPRPAHTSEHAGGLFDSPPAVLRAVLHRAPRRAAVWPSERYYYFTLRDGHDLISGNLRLTDAESGLLHIGYFDAHDPLRLHAATFSLADGLRVDWDEARRVATVTFAGCTRRFVLDAHSAAPPQLALLDGETAITRILDESGFAFVLVYCEPARRFYYVLDPSSPLPEPTTRLRSTLNLTIGVESRFVFLTHEPTGRRILVGVWADNIRRNNYFDGPFDQVPPRLPLRPLLEAAYPYVTLRGGIDEHGNFNHLPGQRVAITPYQAYESLSSLVAWLESVVRPDEHMPWLPAVFEDKSIFHLRLHRTEPDAAPAALHTLDLSRSWPANHWGDMSIRWPDTHEAPLSRSWPPNHRASLSSDATP